MISIDTKLSGDITVALDRFEKRIKEKVLLSGVAAMANVIYDEVELNAAPPRMGRVTGNLSASIYRVFAEDRSTEDMKVYRVSWNRTTAPHGHLLEFGTSRMRARPFLRPAFDRVQDAIHAGRKRMAERIAEGT